MSDRTFYPLANAWERDPNFTNATHKQHASVAAVVKACDLITWEASYPAVPQADVELRDTAHNVYYVVSWEGSVQEVGRLIRVDFARSRLPKDAA